jgi:hypothetical protein
MHPDLLLRGELDRLVLRARPRLRAYSVRRECAEFLERAALLLSVAPVALFVSQGLALGGVATPPFPPLWLAAAGSLVLPLLYLCWSLARSYYRGALVRSTALALYDRQLDLQDRLVTAEEFLGREQVDAFSAAAIEDAASFVSLAQQAHLNSISSSTAALRACTGWYVGGAVVVLSLAAGMSGLRDSAPQTAGGLPARPETGSVSFARERPAVDAPARTPGGKRPPDKRDGAAGSAATPTSAMPASMAGNNTSGAAGSAGMESAGASGAGSAGGTPPSAPPERSGGQQTQSTPSGSAAAGASGASGEGQSGSSGAGGGGDSADKSASGGSGDDASGEDRSGQDRSAAGAARNAAEGASGTDSRNATDKRGGAGAQPGSARNAQGGTRSRDAAGSPAANGGPGEGQGSGPGSKTGEKKSRGVASLILGEPLPDRVQGQPSAGPTRTTQQQVAPQPESAAPAQAQARDARSTAMQPLVRTPSPPWMQDLIERYFSRPRAGGSKQ